MQPPNQPTNESPPLPPQTPRVHVYPPSESVVQMVREPWLGIFRAPPQRDQPDTRRLDHRVLKPLNVENFLGDVFIQSCAGFTSEMLILLFQNVRIITGSLRIRANQISRMAHFPTSSQLRATYWLGRTRRWSL